MTQEQINRIRRTLTDLVEVAKCGEECNDFVKTAQEDLAAFNRMVFVYTEEQKRKQREFEEAESKRKDKERTAIFFMNSPYNDY